MSYSPEVQRIVETLMTASTVEPLQTALTALQRVAGEVLRPEAQIYVVRDVCVPLYWLLQAPPDPSVAYRILDVFVQTRLPWGDALRQQDGAPALFAALLRGASTLEQQRCAAAALHYLTNTRLSHWFVTKVFQAGTAGVLVRHLRQATDEILQGHLVAAMVSLGCNKVVEGTLLDAGAFEPLCAFEDTNEYVKEWLEDVRNDEALWERVTAATALSTARAVQAMQSPEHITLPASKKPRGHYTATVDVSDAIVEQAAQHHKKYNCATHTRATQTKKQEWHPDGETPAIYTAMQTNDPCIDVGLGRTTVYETGVALQQPEWHPMEEDNECNTHTRSTQTVEQGIPLHAVDTATNTSDLWQMHWKAIVETVHRRAGNGVRTTKDHISSLALVMKRQSWNDAQFKQFILEESVQCLDDKGCITLPDPLNSYDIRGGKRLTRFLQNMHRHFTLGPNGDVKHGASENGASEAHTCSR